MTSLVKTNKDIAISATPAAFPRLVITGPTGWIGTVFLAQLARANAQWPRGVTLFGSSARQVDAPDGTSFAMRSFDTIGPKDVEGALVLHLAYLTKEKVELLGERAFFDTNSAIDERLLAACRDGRPRGVFVASSGAAALAERGRDRHLYGMCKLLQEDRFLDFGAKAGVPVLAGRIYNLGGPWINKLSAYAISNMLVQAFDTGAVRINATVPVYRSYLHVEDLCALVLAGLEDGLAPGRPVDLCGAEIVEMAHVAEEVVRVAGLGAVAIVREPLDYDRPAIYVGDPTQTLTLALRYGIRLRGLAAQVADTALYLREKR